MGAEFLPWEISDTAHMIRRAYERRAAVLGVTRAQWRVLLFLGRETNLRQVELADRLDIEPITLCRIIDRLEQAELVERRRDPADRRAWRLALTDKARPILESLHGVAAELGAEALDRLEPAQIDALRSGLATIRDNLSQAAAPPNRASA
ncbi:MAG: MarR family transcriptional regulator [Sphingomicrobium sp.]